MYTCLRIPKKRPPLYPSHTTLAYFSRASKSIEAAVTYHLDNDATSAAIMAIFSAFTVIRGISLLHLTAAYLLLTNPRDVAEQNIIVILGEAMQIVSLPCHPHHPLPSPLSSFLFLAIHLPTYLYPPPASLLPTQQKLTNILHSHT